MLKYHTSLVFQKQKSIGLFDTEAENNIFEKLRRMFVTQQNFFNKIPP